MESPLPASDALIRRLLSALNVIYIPAGLITLHMEKNMKKRSIGNWLLALLLFGSVASADNDLVVGPASEWPDWVLNQCGPYCVVKLELDGVTLRYMVAPEANQSMLFGRSLTDSRRHRAPTHESRISVYPIDGVNPVAGLASDCPFDPEHYPWEEGDLLWKVIESNGTVMRGTYIGAGNQIVVVTDASGNVVSTDIVPATPQPPSGSGDGDGTNTDDCFPDAPF